MQANRTATVLFAEPSSGTKRSEASRKALARAVVSIAEATGGRVVKTIGGKLMVVFASPAAARSAASKMQAKIDALAPVDGIKIGVHIAFHSGPVVKGALADDTVRLALRMVEQAHDGQTITSQFTAQQLNPAFRPFSKRAHATREAASGQPDVCEVASWHQIGVRPARGGPLARRRPACGDHPRPRSRGAKPARVAGA